MLYLILVDALTHERIDARCWSLHDAHDAMACLREGCHLAVVSSSQVGGA